MHSLTCLGRSEDDLLEYRQFTTDCLSLFTDPHYHFSEHGQPTSANEAELTEST